MSLIFDTQNVLRHVEVGVLPVLNAFANEHFADQNLRGGSEIQVEKSPQLLCDEIGPVLLNFLALLETFFDPSSVEAQNGVGESWEGTESVLDRILEINSTS